MMLSLDTAYRSFGGEVEASSTPTICRLSDSRRHQLWAIAPAYGYSPTLPDDFERSMQWAIIRRSIVSTFIPTPDRVALQLRLSAENSFCSIGSRARILPPNHRRIISLAAILHSLCQK